MSNRASRRRAEAARRRQTRKAPPMPPAQPEIPANIQAAVAHVEEAQHLFRKYDLQFTIAQRAQLAAGLTPEGEEREDLLTDANERVAELAPMLASAGLDVLERQAELEEAIENPDKIVTPTPEEKLIVEATA